MDRYGNQRRSGSNVRVNMNTMPVETCGIREVVKESRRSPVGMGYVPWQIWKEVYEPCKALEVGTLFPELNLPFTGGRC